MDVIDLDVLYSLSLIDKKYGELTSKVMDEFAKTPEFKERTQREVKKSLQHIEEMSKKCG